MKKWFISDTHFSRKSIIKDAARPYPSTAEMNKDLIDNWNNHIGQNDQVFFLGDFGQGSVEHLNSICNQLNGHKICIRGDLDRHPGDMYRIGFNVVVESLHIKIGHHTVELIHRPSKSDPLYFQLHGHVHNKSTTFANQINVCVDVCDYKPVSEMEIIDKLNASQPVEAQSSNELISVEYLASSLGLPLQPVQEWIKKDQETIQVNFRERPSVTTKLLEKYSFSPNYLPALQNSIRVENYYRMIEKPKHEIFKSKRLELLKTYKKHIHQLKSIHKKYLGLVNGYHFGSAECAGFLIFSRVIGALELFCYSMQNGYFFSGALLREIDEGLTLAHYFILTKDTQEGKIALHKWFRQNIIPGNGHCRGAISRHWNKHLPNDGIDNKALSDEIYNMKSKFTHHSYAALRDMIDYEVIDGHIIIKEIHYGVCSNEEKMHELTEFFESNIWSVFLTFRECFHHLPLTLEDRQFLKGKNAFFFRINHEFRT